MNTLVSGGTAVLRFEAIAYGPSWARGPRDMGELDYSPDRGDSGRALRGLSALRGPKASPGLAPATISGTSEKGVIRWRRTLREITY